MRFKRPDNRVRGGFPGNCWQAVVAGYKKVHLVRIAVEHFNAVHYKGAVVIYYPHLVVAFRDMKPVVIAILIRGYDYFIIIIFENNLSKWNWLPGININNLAKYFAT